ncbi:anaerobic ribonucleoside-triphosphate reductase activating protein [Desulfitobacterium sp. AusDCA]|uniref:anaerobic ribonucleoside-triphosphate reductase activating protein n=1 Tax=Desulfitobacterium sp. AusDCA TaxID=3240383 RepID=UPI003DA71B52
MGSNVRICGIEPESIVDGKGLRYVIFTQGCRHQCPGCHNPQSHPLDGGKSADIYNLFEEICENPLLTGVTFSGGEPFYQAEPLSKLARMVHIMGLDITTYTGYLYEELVAMRDFHINVLLEQTDTLIDGPFVLAEKDLTLVFRGSRNQRIIDMNETRRSGKLMLEKQVS